MPTARDYIDISKDGVWSISDDVVDLCFKQDQDDGLVTPKEKTSKYNYILMLLYIFAYKRRYDKDEAFVCGIYMLGFFRMLFYNTHIKTKLTNPEKFYNYTKRWLQEHEGHIKRLENEGMKSFSILDSLSISFGRHLKEIINYQQ